MRGSLKALEGSTIAAARVGGEIVVEELGMVVAVREWVVLVRRERRPLRVYLEGEARRPQDRRRERRESEVV
jgi:hypothetical protein